MKHVLLLVALTGCVSDLAVGVSTRAIDEPDASVDVLDATVFKVDSGPIAVYREDASFTRDASHDAGRDAGYDAGPHWEACLEGDCIASLVPVDQCDGKPGVCARPYPDYACQYTCELEAH